jgi:acetyl-CoA carboxylase carboxyl transferase subunit alpha
MGITADRLDKLDLVDEVLKEPLGGAHRDPQAMAEALKVSLLKHLGEVGQWSEEDLVTRRYERLRGQGVYRATG